MQATVIVPGNLDGVHLGHQALIKRAQELSSQFEGSRVLALFFDPHPVTFFRPEIKVEQITTRLRREALLLAHGADQVAVEQFDRQFSNLSPEDFIVDVLIKKYGCVGLVVGPDFRFGKGRAGDVALLQDLAKRFDLNADVFQPVILDGDVVSSSRIRAAISEGRLEEATKLLGRYHDADGLVVHGDGRARKLGFPTANLESGQVLLPLDGVYAVWVEILSPQNENLGEAKIAGVANLGVRPTFDAGRCFEVHLLDFADDLYGKKLRVYFVDRIRSEKMFSNVEALKEQLRKDCEYAKRLLRENE